MIAMHPPSQTFSNSTYSTRFVGFNAWEPQGTSVSTFTHQMPRVERGADDFETTTRKGHFRIEKNDREALKTMTFNTLLLKYFDERSSNDTAPGKHGLAAKALGVWGRNERQDDAAKLHELLPSLQAFFKHYWDLMRAAITREPSMREAVLREGKTLSTHALSNVLNGGNPMDACIGVTSDSLLKNAQQAVEQARMNEFQQHQKAFYGRPGNIMGATKNSTWPEMGDLMSGVVTVTLGNANTDHALRQLPAGLPSTPSAPVDPVRTNSAQDVSIYQTAIYPRMPWPANLKKIYVHGPGGQKTQVELFREGNNILCSTDQGATRRHLGTTSDAMELKKQRNYELFMQGVTKLFIERKAKERIASSHFAMLSGEDEQRTPKRNRTRTRP